jgi:large subunit ribosomal protein L10
MKISVLRGCKTMIRSEKENVVSSMRENLQASTLVVVTSQSGLTVTEVSNLRDLMRSSGAKYKVLKNTLARIAVKDTQCEGITDLLNGPTALAFSQDPVAAARVVVEYSEKNEKIKVLGGCLGDKVLNANEVKALAKLPSLDELRAQILGVIVAPATKIARTVREPAAQLARVISAYGNK